MEGCVLRDPFGQAILLGFGSPEGVRVGWGVSEAQAAFGAKRAWVRSESLVIRGDNRSQDVAALLAQAAAESLCL
jgi:hypothetical protein